MMNEDIATTPFGGGQFVARQYLRRKQVSAEQAHRKAGGASGQGADKWLLLRALTEARSAYDLSDRSIAVLEALLSFHPERILDGAKPLIVFPSNRQLSLRTRGMSPATLRRHLAALVEAGLIFRRDSPNGKRYCRRDAQGAPSDMFGFDLAPLALAYDAIQAQAERQRAEELQRQDLRAEITLHLRDIAKLLQTALNETPARDWDAFAERHEALSGRVSRQATIPALNARRQQLLKLRAELETAFLDAVTGDAGEPKMSACELQNEHHIQKTESDQILESAVEESEDCYPANNHNTRPNSEAIGIEHPVRNNGDSLSLPRILRACPQIADYSRNGIANWADFMGAVALVRSMLQISPAAWSNACAVMGERQAAVAVAAMLERAEHIRGPGAYLRALARKAGIGRCAGLAMMQALERHAEGQGRRHLV
jgi:replication initiation protein RepC